MQTLGNILRSSQSEPTEETRVARDVSGHRVKHEAEGHVSQIPWTPMFQDKEHNPDRKVLECAAELLGKIADSISIPDPKDFSPNKTLLFKLFLLHHLSLML